ncbi:MAG: hypothetical protein Q9221_003202 [Calogaya cf. arnoldii]
MGSICNSITEANCGTEINDATRDLPYTDLVNVERNVNPPDISRLERRQIWLCATNIVAMSAFFNTWYTAAQSALSSVSNSANAIVSAAAPPPESPTQVASTIVINALLAGLAFLPGVGPAGAGVAGAAKGLGAAAQSARAVAQQITQSLSTARRTAAALEAPGRAILAGSSVVFGRLFNTDGSAESTLINIASLTEQAGYLANSLTSRLNVTLGLSVNNVTEFLGMADLGAFSGDKPPDLASAADVLRSGFQTYLVSIALNSASWYGVVAPNTDVTTLLANEKNIDLGCLAVDPATKRCNAIWHDVANNQGFTMVQGTSLLNNPSDMFKKYFDSSTGTPLTTPEELFTGAARCRLRPGQGRDTSVAIVNGELNFDCLSQLKICTYNYECTQGESGASGGCKYLESDCSAEPGYGYIHDRHYGAGDNNPQDDDFYVEPGYMGPFRTGELEHPLRWTGSLGDAEASCLTESCSGVA